MLNDFIQQTAQNFKRELFQDPKTETSFLQLDRLRNGEGRGKLERTLSFNFN